jgi:hypothetical protein
MDINMTPRSHDVVSHTKISGRALPYSANDTLDLEYGLNSTLPFQNKRPAELFKLNTLALMRFSGRSGVSANKVAAANDSQGENSESTSERDNDFAL